MKESKIVRLNKVKDLLFNALSYIEDAEKMSIEFEMLNYELEVMEEKLYGIIEGIATGDYK